MNYRSCSSLASTTQSKRIGHQLYKMPVPKLSVKIEKIYHGTYFTEFVHILVM